MWLYTGCMGSYRLNGLNLRVATGGESGPDRDARSSGSGINSGAGVVSRSLRGGVESDSDIGVGSPLDLDPHPRRRSAREGRPLLDWTQPPGRPEASAE